MIPAANMIYLFYTSYRGGGAYEDARGLGGYDDMGYEHHRGML